MEADLEAHAARLALLTVDVAHLPIEPLREAIKRWSAMKPYLPKASELIEMTRQAAQPSKAGPSARAALLERQRIWGNQQLDLASRYDIRWIVRNDSLRLIDVKELEAEERQRRDPCNPDAVRRIMAGL